MFVLLVGQNRDDNDAGAEMAATRERCSVELELYMKTARLGLTYTVTDNNGNEKEVYENVLKWWKKNHLKYPSLASLAKMYLAIQGTFAPSERVFSVAGRLISRGGANLDPMFAGKMFFVAENHGWYENEKNQPVEIE